MIRWNNDYNQGAHEKVLAALAENNGNSYAGYGLDECCERAKAAILPYLKNDKADIHFLLGGTQVNYTVIAAALRPYEGVLCAANGHIHTHETGAVENTGHKILALEACEGKLTAESVRAAAEEYAESGVQEHVVQPKLVFISNPSEFGTVYSKKELQALRIVCDEYGLYLYMDGARLGYGLGSPSCDYSLADIAGLTDAFYIGGTKCGALFGEALVILNDALKPHFRSFMKQNGALLAKGFLLGLQFEALFSDGLYFDITRKAAEQAMRIKAAFAERGIPFYMENETNQQFVILNAQQAEQIGARHIFEDEGKTADGLQIARFCTSWSTKDEDVEELIRDIATL